MAPTVKLTYFDMYGIVEPARLLLKYGGIEFEDIRVERSDWPKLKPNAPYGQLPLYEENGKPVINQSKSIARYIAKKVKLVGDNDWENLEIDAFVDAIHDLLLKISLYFYEQDPVIKESRKSPLFNETIPFYLERLDEAAKKNNGHLVAGKLTWADIYFVGLLDYMNFMVPLYIEKYPNLKCLKDNVLAVPAIKNWVNSRPKTKN